MLSNVYAKSYVLTSPTTHEITKQIIYKRLLPLIANVANNKKPLEMLSLSYAYAMDSFMAYQYGLSLSSNFIQNAEERQWFLERFFAKRPWMFWAVEVPNFSSLVAKFGIQLWPKWTDTAAEDLENWSLNICDRAEDLLSSEITPAAVDTPVIYAQQRAAMRKHYQTSSSDIEKSTQTQQQLQDPNLLKINQPYPHRLEIASDMHCHSAAALETSGDTLTYIYYELSRRPDLQSKLRSELLSIENPLLYPPTSSEIELPDPKTLDSLPILDSILQETLRLWPAVPGAQPRVTPAAGCTLAGYENIPGGVRVQASTFAIHKNGEVFPEPEEWKPERWVDASKEELVEMRRWFWGWGSGGRMCIGSNVAVHSKFNSSLFFSC